MYIGASSSLTKSHYYHTLAAAVLQSSTDQALRCQWREQLRRRAINPLVHAFDVVDHRLSRPPLFRLSARPQWARDPTRLLREPIANLARSHLELRAELAQPLADVTRDVAADVGEDRRNAPDVELAALLVLAARPLRGMIGRRTRTNRARR